MGYMRGGTILKVDLTTGKVHKEPTARYEKLWIGARGLNARIIYEEVGPEVKPQDPGNALIFSVGPLTGTMAPGCGRTEIAAKSPMTGVQGMSNLGGYWGPQLKYAGYDSLIIVGKAPRPVYIAIYNDDVQIKEASHLWGMDTYKTQVAITSELGDLDAEVACIGPAGENMVSYATIQTRIGNAAGRTGMGAVMGVKNLKAVSVRGTKGVRVADPEKFFELSLEAFKIQKTIAPFTRTTHVVSNEPPTTALTLGNFEATKWDKQSTFVRGHEQFWQDHKNRSGEGKIGCFNCQIRCMDYYDRDDLGPIMASCNVYASTMWLVKDPNFISWYALVARCQRDGLDVMSVSRMIAWAMELYEKGTISKEDTDGISLLWGDGDAIDLMLKKIVKREGFGDVLASTPHEAKGKIGRGVQEALNIKGLPIGGNNVLNFRSRAIAAAMSPRGGDEFRTRYSTFDSIGCADKSGVTGMASLDSWEAKTASAIAEKALAKEGDLIENIAIGQFDNIARGALTALSQKLVTVSDMLGQCKWNTIFHNRGIGIEIQSELISAGEGRKWSIDDFLESATRIAAQERAFAVRHGLTAEHDTLPERLFNHQMPGSWPEDELDPVEFEKMKEEYYQAMNWDVKTGIPSSQTLNSLNLSDVAADLAKLCKLSEEEGTETARNNEKTILFLIGS